MWRPGIHKLSRGIQFEGLGPGNWGPGGLGPGGTGARGDWGPGPGACGGPVAPWFIIYVSDCNSPT